MLENDFVTDMPRRWLVNIQIGLFFAPSSLLKMALPMSHEFLLTPNTRLNEAKTRGS